jgi:hypothetical protein
LYSCSLLQTKLSHFVLVGCQCVLPRVVITCYFSSLQIDDINNSTFCVNFSFLFGCRSIIEKLGPGRISKIKIVGKEVVEGSLYGQLVLGKGVASSLDEQLVKEAQKAGEHTGAASTFFSHNNFI